LHALQFGWIDFLDFALRFIDQLFVLRQWHGEILKQPLASSH
jgi:hypothetical protein